MSRKKMRSKADEFEMDEAGYDEEPAARSLSSARPR